MSIMDELAARRDAIAARLDDDTLTGTESRLGAHRGRGGPVLDRGRQRRDRRRQRPAHPCAWRPGRPSWPSGPRTPRRPSPRARPRAPGPSGPSTGPSASCPPPPWPTSACQRHGGRIGVEIEDFGTRAVGRQLHHLRWRLPEPVPAGRDGPGDHGPDAPHRGPHAAREHHQQQHRVRAGHHRCRRRCGRRSGGRLGQARVHLHVRGRHRAGADRGPLDQRHPPGRGRQQRRSSATCVGAWPTASSTATTASSSTATAPRPTCAAS